MSHRCTLVIAGAALAALPNVAQAQASQQVLLTSTVARSCGMGAPTTTTINLQDLTGPNGALDPAKTGNDVLGSTTIADAWCNGPHRLSMVTHPMRLQRNLSYAVPAYMTRQITFDATLQGWGDELAVRPRNGGDTAFKNVSSARAATAPGLQLNISRLQSQTATGDEQTNLMLEAGNYRGTVTIILAVN